MKKILMIICLGCVIAFAGLADHAMGQTVSVQVKIAQLRSGPSFMGKVVANLKYGDPVFVLEEKGPWRQVELDDEKTRGWVHSSALSKKEIAFEAGERVAIKAISGNELALGGKASGTGGVDEAMIAGKGFNKESEAEFRQGNPNIDYTWIDKMETYRVSQKEIARFLKKGALQSGGGN